MRLMAMPAAAVRVSTPNLENGLSLNLLQPDRLQTVEKDHYVGELS